MRSHMRVIASTCNIGLGLVTGKKESDTCASGEVIGMSMIRSSGEHWERVGLCGWCKVLGAAGWLHEIWFLVCNAAGWRDRDLASGWPSKEQLNDAGNARVASIVVVLL